ncbi:sigma-70 family RNA polymerase sigma factor [Nocardiopsis sp. NPDC101807]|uniref:sigma-70 family RNA polymerase sigma factor n=1 Tax=Nocardiopsis sp. NPDC101807 TaxID=3364339 RepID=UPI003801084D
MRGGDTAAYATLYERHAASARGLARQLLRGEAEAEDAVAEAFTRVLSVIRRGKGPEDSFRPYLLTAVRNAAYDRGRGEKRQVVTDDMESLVPGQPFVDPALEGLERSLIARAFLSLPERWQAVLWHTEIEGTKPAEAAPLLGMNPNGVAALAYRAREGLRQAYLQMHLAGGAAAEACRPTLGLLGGYVRGGLSKRDTAKVDTHMDGCADCREVYAELMDVNVGLRGVVLPLVVGSGAAGYLALTPGGAATGAWWGRMSRRQQQAAAGGTAAAGMAVAVALALTGAEAPPGPEAPPPVAAPQEEPVPVPAPGDPAAPDTPPGPPPAAPPADAPPPAAPEETPAPDRPVPPAAPDRPAPPAAPAVPPADVPEEEVVEDAPEPLFAAGIDPVGALLPGSEGIVVLDVRNLGASTVEDVVAVITLPPGVEMISSGGAGSSVPMADGNGDWSCSSGSGGGRCAHPRMASGQNSTQFLDVRVDAGADVGVPASVTVSSGGVAASATGERGVSSEGVAARYATAGRVRTESVGNALMTCVEPERDHGGHWPWPWPWRPGNPGVPGEDPGAGVTPDADGRTGPEADADLARAPRGPLFAEPGTEQSPEGASPEEGGTRGEEGISEDGADDADDADDADGEDGGTPDGAGARPDGASPTDPARDPAQEDADGGHGHGPGPDPSPGAGPEEGTPGGPCADARLREGENRDNDNWVMAPLEDDPDAATSASAATWELPEGGAVRWAGLYFSAAGAPDAPTARVRGPGMTSYRTVAATETKVADLPGYPAYQAFAEVTDLVRAQGGGEWWVGDVPAREGRGVYAGWSLVVVLEDPGIGSYNQAMVLDDTGAVFRSRTGMSFPVSGLLPAAVPSRVDVVAWEGDADLRGDRVTVDGRAVAPSGGHGEEDNAFASSARGAVGDPFTFGTDVVRFDPVLGRETDIRILTEQDAVLVGVVALTAPMRT